MKHSICHYSTMNQQNDLDIVDPKYQRTIIYGIICLITGEMYVGSTIRTLKRRMELHRCQPGCSSFQILQRGNYKAYEIQRWPCKTRREKLTLEGGWQRAYKASFPEHFVNRHIEGVFLRDSPEARRNYKRGYYQEHKEEKKESNHKYYQANKEKAKVNSKRQREEKKDELRAKRMQPWTCEWCHKTLRYSSRNYHKKKACKCKPAE